MSKWGTFIQRRQDGELSEREKKIFAEKLKKARKRNRKLLERK